MDENLPKKLEHVLRAKGYYTIRAIDKGLRGQPDSAIFRQFRSQATIITRDKDFLQTDLFPTPHSGIIVIRLPNYMSVTDLVLEVVNALTNLQGQDLANQVYIIEPGRISLYS